MKISYKWLKSIIPFEWSVAELADKLTMSGTEVEFIDKIGGISEQVVTAKVISVKKHPDADKLTVCEVFDGNSISQVVCGAPNVAEEQIVLFAKIGASLPNGMNIKKSKIRGVESFGMICSFAELNINEEGSGIAVLPPHLEVGLKAEELFSGSDHVLELEVTPNRPDCLSHRGIAREIQALGGGSLPALDFKLVESGPPIFGEFSIEIENPSECPRYAARLIRNVEIKPSPAWLSDRLQAVGIRPTNNVVDVTNYVMMEYGHPLHAFDIGLFSNKKIIVKGAQEKEKFITLDGIERELPEGAILITDGVKPVALGGIMGGLNTEVSEKTSEILLEAAYFNPITIRKTVKALKLSSESSQRFERGADYNGLILALNRAAQLIGELAGGQIAEGIADCYPHKFEDKAIALRVSKANDLLGTSLSLDGIMRILNSLEINTVTIGPESLRSIIPSFRPDLSRPADLIEEIARIYGLEKIPSAKALDGSLEVEIPESFTLMDKSRQFFVGCGFDEVINWVLYDPQKYMKLNYPFNPVRISNPLSNETAILRPHLWGSLLDNVAYNLNRNLIDIRIFEIDRVFNSAGPGKLPFESLMLGVAWTGNAEKSGWANTKRLVDVFDLKGLAEDFLEHQNIGDFKFSETQNQFLSQEYCSGISISGAEAGALGLLSRDAAGVFDIKAPVWLMAINLDAIMAKQSEPKLFREPAKFPPSDRDLAIVLDNSIRVGALLDYLKGLHQEFVEDIRLFDLYSGKQIPDGKKSIALSFRFRHPDRTLNESEIDTAMKYVLNALKAKYALDLRY